MCKHILTQTQLQTVICFDFTTAFHTFNVGKLLKQFKSNIDDF